MMRQPLYLLVLCIVSTGCSSADAPTEDEPQETRATAETLRPALGRTNEVCAGQSLDPPADQLRFLESIDTPQALREARLRLESLAGAYGQSATLRVLLGELSLRQQPPDPHVAQRRFERALALHHADCRLDALHASKAYEGQAIAHIMQRDYAGAIAPLQEALERWPALRSARYNLACALCQTGEIEACRGALARVLSTSSAELPETFDESRRPPGYFRRLAPRDPDLQPLRDRDPEGFATLLR